MDHLLALFLLAASASDSSWMIMLWSMKVLIPRGFLITASGGMPVRWKM